MKRGLAQQLVGQVGANLYLLRPGSGPHQDLSVRSNLFDDLPDLGFEAHVEHPAKEIKVFIQLTTPSKPCNVEPQLFVILKI